MNTQSQSAGSFDHSDIVGSYSLITVEDLDHGVDQQASKRELDFAKYDRIVRSGLGSFQIMGAALKSLKAESLWVKTSVNWTAYCASIGISRVQGNRLIFAAKVYRVISEEASKEPGLIARLPVSEWQIRPLSKDMLDRDVLDSWILAIQLADGSNPSEKIVSAAVRQTLGEEPEAKPPKKNNQAILTEMVANLADLVKGRETDRGMVSFHTISLAFEELKSFIKGIA